MNNKNMKKITILFLIVSLLIVSCQKKQYAYFQSSPNAVLVKEKKSIALAVEPKTESILLGEMEVEKPINVTASINEEINISFKKSDNVIEAEDKMENKDFQKSYKKSLVEKKVERVVARKIIKLAKMNHTGNGSGWNGLNSTLKLGILLILASILIGLIPFLGWLLGGIVGLIGVVLLLWGILIQIS